MTLSNEQHTFYIVESRRLLASSLDMPEFASQISEDTSFLDAGVNSGELILLQLQCEKYLNVEVNDDELFNITSLRKLSELLYRYATGSNHVV